MYLKLKVVVKSNEDLAKEKAGIEVDYDGVYDPRSYYYFNLNNISAFNSDRENNNFTFIHYANSTFCTEIRTPEFGKS